MKNLQLLGFLMLFASSFMFIQCTSDPIEGPQGIAGVDGVDGVDGTNGVDGVDGTASCVACHSDSHRDPINAAFDTSGHWNQTTVPWAGNAPLSEYTNRGGDTAALSNKCAVCHSNEGYIDYMETGTIPIDPYASATAVSCTTCHNSHSTFDFENDGHDYALRTMAGIDLMIGSTLDNPSGMVDYGNSSNNCAFCHQPRKLRPTEYGDVVNGMFDVPSHYGPHYGAQVTMLEGIQGENIAGDETYPIAGSATHRTAASCVSCHMGESDVTAEGTHSFAPTLNSCLTCHSSATDFDYHGVQTEVETLMHEIEVLLIAEGILDDSGSLITGDHPLDIVQGYWNWEYVHQDGSHGVHNPKYTLALLKNTKQYLETVQTP